jgi:SAM-dependent methyltransferase
LAQAAPAQVYGVEPSEGYLAVARTQVRDPRASFQPGKAGELPFTADRFDVVVSGLVLNFVPNVESAMTELRRVTRPGGTIAAYVWDYAGKMELMRYFWDAAVALKAEAWQRDEGVRFPLCKPQPLHEIFRNSGLHHVEVQAIDIATHFRDFDDYWRPFLGGQFPAPDYAMSLSEEDRQALRERIRTSLPIEADNSIRLIARAWAVRGRV